jgi:hypothetical protein
MDCLVNMGTIQEDILYLEEWLDQATNLAHKLRSEAQNNGGKTFFTINATVKINENKLPYLTPFRKVEKGYVGGSVVFSQTQAVILSDRIDGIVDYILVDAEKKIGISLGYNKELFKHFGIDWEDDKQKTIKHVEMGNISAASSSHIKKSDFQEFKPNDITVESVWHFLSDWFHTLHGKRIAIIGAGNIGFKLALKLVECGCHVELVRRDMARGNLMADTINITKPISTMAIAHSNNNSLQASLFCDALIGCTDGVPAINYEMIQTMALNGIVIDVGKGCVYKDAIEKAVQSSIKIIRCDVYSALDGFITTMLRNKLICSSQMGRREIRPSIFVVSGGYMGLLDDVVVDNYQIPSQIIGVANGMGDLKTQLSQKNQNDCLIIKGGIEK